MLLTSAQLDSYKQYGFLVIDDFVDDTACARLKTRANQIVAEFDPGYAVSIFSTRDQSRVTNDYFLDSASQIHCFFEEHAFNPDGTLKQSKEKSINKIGHALHDLDPTFESFSRSDKVKSLIDDLVITQPLLLQSMYIFKQPNIGGEVTCHQDSTFLYTEPNEIVGLWFALEDATIDNGCLWAIPGGHQTGLKSRWLRGKNGMELRVFDSTAWPEEQLVPLEVAKGSLILLDGLLPHRSYENKSDRSRHAYTLHVISGEANYPKDNWLQRVEMPLRGF